MTDLDNETLARLAAMKVGTPGPWEIDKLPDQPNGLHIIWTGPDVVCEINPRAHPRICTKRIPADAALIAEAWRVPELARLLRWIGMELENKHSEVDKELAECGERPHDLLYGVAKLKGIVATQAKTIKRRRKREEKTEQELDRLRGAIDGWLDYYGSPVFGNASGSFTCDDCGAVHVSEEDFSLDLHDIDCPYRMLKEALGTREEGGERHG